MNNTRCQCPNAWLEFRSRTAKERTRQGLPKLSNAQHVQAYNDAKANGDFDTPAFLAQRVLPCKNDAIKLCTWMTARKRINTARPFANRAWRGNQWNVQSRVLRETAHQVRQQTANDTRASSALRKVRAEPFVHMFAGHHAHVNVNNVFEFVKASLGMTNLVRRIERYLGGGASGLVFEVVMQGHQQLRMAAKVQALANAAEEIAFKREFYVQKRIGEAPRKPFRTAKVDSSQNIPYMVVRVGNKSFGVMFMERIDGVLETLIQTRRDDMRAAFAPASTLTNPQKAKKAREYKSFLVDIATQLRGLVEAMRRYGFVHGDLHVGNIGYVVSGLRPKLVLIDFGRTIAFVDDIVPRGHAVLDDIDHFKEWGVDEFLVWRISLYYPDDMSAMYGGWTLNKALVHVGFPGSEYIRVYGDRVARQPAGSDKFTLASGVDVRNIDREITGPAVVVPIYDAIKATVLPANAAQPFVVPWTVAQQTQRLRSRLLIP